MQSLYGAIANTNKKEIMAVSVNAVYQKVLALANKEQRGYITPQEFNLYADHAQMEIFEQYFYDTDQFERRIGSDVDELIKRKIEPFKSSTQTDFDVNILNIPDEVYLIESVWMKRENGKGVTVEKLDRDSQHTIHAAIEYSPLIKPNESKPVYWIVQNDIRFVPNGKYYINYVKTPKKPNWTYVVVDGKALHNFSASDFQDFELHPSEESKLVVKILQLAGVGIKDYNLAQLAGQKEASVKQQEKQ